MPGMPNLYPSTLENLLMATQRGIDPMAGYQILNDAMAQQQERRDYLRALQEEREAEQEARQAARQQTFAGLGDVVFQGAAGGLPQGAVESQLDFLTAATPGVGPRMGSRLEDLLEQAYPGERIAGPTTTEGLSPSIAAKGTLAEIAQANQARGMTVPAGPQAISPLYVPPPEEASTTALPDLMEIEVPQVNEQGLPKLDQRTNKPLPDQALGAQISNVATEAIAEGVPMEQVTADVAGRLAGQGYGADVIAAALQQIEMMYQLTPPAPPPPPALQASGAAWAGPPGNPRVRPPLAWGTASGGP